MGGDSAFDDQALSLRAGSDSDLGCAEDSAIRSETAPVLAVMLRCWPLVESALRVTPPAVLEGAAGHGAPRFSDEKRAAYVRRGHRRVRGYLDSFNVRVVDLLLRYQLRQGVTGSLGEIGVHHGQLFLVALLNSRVDERTFAVDVFDRQDLNIDGSGLGDETVFRANITRHAGDIDVVDVFARSSLDLSAAELKHQCGPARFVSIDGGHTEDCTLNDLRLADAIVVRRGLVIIDDCFNQSWPGVATGFARYALGENRRLHPFLITPNKVFLSDSGSAGGYLSVMRGELGMFHDKTSEFFGCPVELYGTQRGSSAIYYRARSVLRSRPGLKRKVARMLRLPSAPSN